jgi:hypothetical protein
MVALHTAFLLRSGVVVIAIDFSANSTRITAASANELQRPTTN